MDASFKITREEILKVYAAGPEPVVALFVQQEQRITALEQELQELKKDSHDSGKPPSRDSFERKQLSRKRTTAKRPGGQPEHAGAEGSTGGGDHHHTQRHDTGSQADRYPQAAPRRPQAGTRTSPPVRYAADAFRPLADEDLQEWGL